MRVISGKYKGKILKGFDIDGTRPTMDRVKESIFGIIQNNIKNSVCLDLFAGSGSLGIEALSNGASCCYFVDNGKIYNVLEKNLTGIDNYFLIRQDYRDALEYFFKNNIKFDLIFLDPPYSLNLINHILDYIYNNGLLNDLGLVICEYETEKVFNNNFNELKTKKYGSKYVTVYQKL